MFCPKCGSQNADETKFCRGCGADLSNVLAVVDGRAPAELPAGEREIELRSRAWRGLIAGIGFLIVAGLGFGLSNRTWVMGFFGLIFAFIFLSAGISRFVQAAGLKQLRERRGFGQSPALTPGDPDYVEPPRSLFKTDDLVHAPGSVTEHTTTRLQLDRDTEKSCRGNAEIVKQKS
jgi:hypothetical protein